MAMKLRAALALVFGAIAAPSAHAQLGQNPFNLPDPKLPLGGLGNNMMAPLPGQPMGAFMPPPGTNLMTGQFSAMHNAWGAQTPWPYQNPFTPSHWNYQGMQNGFNNPWAGGGMWNAAPFGQYGYNGVYQGFAPVVGANNGWFGYDTGWNNPWMGGGMGMGYGGMGLPGMGNGMGGPAFNQNMMMPNMMFPR
jgi:hypothetical protein